MKYKYTQALPYSEIIRLASDENVDEIWIIFAYFSKNKVIDIINKLKNRRKKAVVHIVFSSSSVNPLQDVVEEIFELSMFEWCDFHLVDNPLMHSKLFAARYGENIKAYIGSANLTNSANNLNIECGILLNFQNGEKTFKFLNELMGSCHSENSILRLQTKAVLSHFRSELLFLALEESKIRQAISIKPDRIKKILLDSDSEDIEESTVTVKVKNMLNIFILDDRERLDLLQMESKLKDAIKDNFAIKMDGYGWVSSVWSIRKIYSSNDSVNEFFKMFIDTLKKIRNCYRKLEYRNELSQKIKTNILNWIQENDENRPLPEIEKILEHELVIFHLPLNDRKSPYRKIENLYTKLVDSYDLVSLLNPYRIGDDELQQTSDIEDIDILNVDQINLLVMCQLAIKLRSPPGKGKIPKPPSVWWFDIALDDNAYGLYGYCKHTDYKNKTKTMLESIKSDIQQGSNIDECVEKFCEITGFNLGAKYPSIGKLWVWMDDEPYAFLFSSSDSYTRYNINLDGRHGFQGIMLFIDKDKIINEWEVEENDIDLTSVEGEFVLGQNVRLYYDQEEAGSYAYLYINSLRPQVNG
ncbi:MAG: phospholipase D family protein [Bacteroidales bacterium]|nr:phospholipase D family protein [Bacteroidales bacterium]